MDALPDNPWLSAEVLAQLRAGGRGRITALANKLSAMAHERPVIAEGPQKLPREA